MPPRIWINRVSKFIRRIIREYGATCFSTIVQLCLVIGTSLTVLPTLASAEERARFCVLVPHFKDEYWLSVGFGLEQEAARQNVDLLFFEAGGYRARTTQIEQLAACVAGDVDAILIGAVTSDHPDLTNAIAQTALDIPVFGLINALHDADALRGQIGVDWWEMGQVLGDYLSTLHPVGSAPKTAVFLTGPKEAGWTGPLEAGLRQGLSGSAIDILDVFRADTGLRQQLALAERAFEQHPSVDYMIGSAPAIEAAIGLLASRQDTDPPKLLATYVSHTIKRGLMNGSVLAASYDDPMLQARMAIQQAVSTVSTSVPPSGPEVTLLIRGNDNLNAIHTSPAEYFPSLQ